MDTVFISRLSRWVRCKNCKEYLYADQSQIAAYSGLGMLVVGSFQLSTSLLRNERGYWFVPIIIAVAGIILLSYHQSKTIRFTVGEKPSIDNREWDEDERSENLIQFLKGQYKVKTIQELEKMTTNDSLAPEARLAAEQTLNERNLMKGKETTTPNKS